MPSLIVLVRSLKNWSAGSLRRSILVLTVFISDPGQNWAFDKGYTWIEFKFCDINSSLIVLKNKPTVKFLFVYKKINNLFM